jgi:hypothetical protein
MGYIRDNEDYYRLVGHSPTEAKVQAEADLRYGDDGVCNPRKIKERAEVEREIRREIQR